MVGIEMPGHFMIHPQFEDVGIFVDASNRGKIKLDADCEERLTKFIKNQYHQYPQNCCNL